jgi:hypothetical protein
MEHPVTDIAAIERQQRWEVESVDRGVQRYREAEAEVEMYADSEPGKRMMVDTMRRLVPAVEAAQAEALKTLTDPQAGRRPEWMLPILCLGAEKLALITARFAVSGSSRSDGVATSVASNIASAVKLEREFELWRDKQKERGKAGAIDLYKLMTGRVKRVDARTAKKWMKKAEDLDRIEWDTETKVVFGMKLLELLVEHGGGYHEIVVVGAGSNSRRTTTRYVRLTAAAEAYVKDINSSTELDRPWLMPMLCPPQPWKEAA